MHFLLKDTTVDAIIARRGTLMFVGLVLLAQPFVLPRGWAFGVLIGFMLLSLGIYAFAMRRWRTDPGLWMLALVVMCTWGPAYGYFEFWHIFGLIEHWRRGGPVDGKQIRGLVEVILGLSLMWTSVQFAFTVAVNNWRMTRKGVASK